MHPTHSGESQESYAVGEEIANSITHGIGTVLSVIGGIALIVFAALYGDVWRIVSFSIYSVTLVVLYLASTLYHSVRDLRLKRIFKILDHACIYLLIAGTYTPFLLVSLRGPWGWTLLGVIWGLALVGIIFKTFSAQRFRRFVVLGYLLMGWLCVIAGRELLLRVPAEGLFWLALGGLLYTVGVPFYAWRKLPYGHAIWHLFVLGGSLCHYLAVLSLLAKA
ncbi:MAG: hemolysin III family protein [Candidatus Bipolaricaulota bacterium]|nr:hemolysin III family protein [Candidatus Bipolaricaulota bacterium]MDW8141484.1 hemolysin III family protein [Candidatus Bipolaricaulota bacterium]